MSSFVEFFHVLPRLGLLIGTDGNTGSLQFYDHQLSNSDFTARFLVEIWNSVKANAAVSNDHKIGTVACTFRLASKKLANDGRHALVGGELDGLELRAKNP